MTDFNLSTSLVSIHNRMDDLNTIALVIKLTIEVKNAFPTGAESGWIMIPVSTGIWTLYLILCPLRAAYRASRGQYVPYG